MTSRDSATLRWIRQRLAMSAPLGLPPRLGSNDWHSLPDDDARKHAAVLVAALAHWNDCRPEVIAVRLRDELAAAQQVDDDAWARMAARVRAHANSPTWAQIRQRWAS